MTTNDEIAYTWHGVWNEGANGWYEFFGGEDGLPARDLTAADVASFSDAQTEKLTGPAGQRLYRPAAKKATGGSGKAADAVSA